MRSSPTRINKDYERSKDATNVAPGITTNGAFVLLITRTKRKPPNSQSGCPGKCHRSSCPGKHLVISGGEKLTRMAENRVIIMSITISYYFHASSCTCNLKHSIIFNHLRGVAWSRSFLAKAPKMPGLFIPFLASTTPHGLFGCGRWMKHLLKSFLNPSHRIVDSPSQSWPGP